MGKNGIHPKSVHLSIWNRTSFVTESISRRVSRISIAPSTMKSLSSSSCLTKASVFMAFIILFEPAPGQKPTKLLTTSSRIRRVLLPIRISEVEIAMLSSMISRICCKQKVSKSVSMKNTYWIFETQGTY